MRNGFEEDRGFGRGGAGCHRLRGTQPQQPPARDAERGTTSGARAAGVGGDDGGCGGVLGSRAGSAGAQGAVKW